ncbi:hypothetical protein CYMTET_3468 [Cymbomonas tetramitiformis]|uniref:Plastid lipid-associated protein/fibrillin conserved domain-containing protein n=1 Tax=Cymbomonas tetramitiformis TaxID=36881 RepID=A0AAE0LLH1_9CHLO|nr:hypothetical protein CYMTET_3468 [Cymbomonas tetramitiformis]
MTPTVSDRLLVNEMLLSVESENPTPSPAYSPLLEGTWEVVYSGTVSPGLVPSPTREIALAMYAGGFSPGTFAYQVANRLPAELIKTSPLSLTILPDQPRIEITSEVTVFNSSAQTLKLRNTLDVESDMRIRETYSEAEVSGQGIAVPEALKYERLLFITYLDEDMMVARDDTGAPDILVRTSALIVDEITDDEDLITTEEAVIESDPQSD